MKNDSETINLEALETVNNDAHLHRTIEIIPGEYITCQSLIKQYYRLKNELKECEMKGNGLNKVS